MEKAVPQIRIIDYKEAVDFYCDILGFDIAFEWRHEPGFPVYMGIKRGDLYVHLSEHEGNGKPGGGHGMTLIVDDVNAWYESLKQKNVKFEQELKTQDWGNRDFILKDPFGNQIAIVQSD